MNKQTKIELRKTVKCKECGTLQEVSRDGWVEDVITKKKREVRYVEWIHVVGHWHSNGKLCPGSGESPS